MIKKIIVLFVAFLVAHSLHLEHMGSVFQQDHNEIDNKIFHLLSSFVQPVPGRNYEQIRNSYLGRIQQGPSVNLQQAYKLAQFFDSPSGNAVLTFFSDRVRSPNGQVIGLNTYNLSDRNFKLWMAIRILAGPKQDVYARSIALDKNLFVQFINIAIIRQQQRGQSNQ